MKDNHPIDDLFRDAISPYQLSPSENVWNSLDKKLQAKANPGKMYKINKTVLTGAAIIGSLASLLVAYYFVSHENNQAKKLIAQTVAPTTNHAESFIANTISDKSESVPNVKQNPTSAKTSVTKYSVIKNTSTENIPSEKSEIDNSIFSTKPPLLIDGFVKTEPEPFVPTEKKDNSDKAILLMPYFPSENSSNQTDNQTEGKAANNNTNAEPVVKAESTVFVPNAFTPNGDGLNDTFTPQTSENLKEYKLTIYDKNSNVVFSSDDIHRGWDGHIQNNGVETTKSDMYLWRIELKNSKGEKEHLMGYLNLLNDK